ncbi:MAG: bifunctional (p)ppGpp synthetase/guanosine-3',5'-bis(diphosphate) 3'-pyrophosphohydrolase [Tissierellales bacterium]|jgi:GTP pyrophosphokinase|nr:bifunctional (p)ppGpp synthetase/guanosine-3',5'-bis(diphosphate) 3'-pyrophosphohydrolase [Tissierellales bacterium]
MASEYLSVDYLIEKIEEYNPEGDFEIIVRAYDLAKKSHDGQLRNSGEEFFMHPYNVALILAELKMDIATIASALLHDVVEDTEITKEDIADEFGEEIAYLVEGVTKLTKMTYHSKEERLAENMRKMVIAMSKDIRVIIIKLADRVHNMRTLEYMSEAKKREKALEVVEIYAPIANRLGIFKIKWELEDLSLRFLDPDGYYNLVEKVSMKRQEREKYINEVSEALKEKLDQMGIENEIYGRPKHFYSIYKKMVYKNKDFDQIFDLIAIRVIVDSVKDCYGVLGIVHTLWKPLPRRFKDYIATPKANMYQSLHTTVIGPNGGTFEIQIRTKDMHRTAEYGIAAHWMYKEGVQEPEKMDQKLNWIMQMLEWQKETKDPKEFMESLKIDLYQDEVFVFTPKGDVINLPQGSTPLDFAYRVHTAVGNACVGAKVDGKIVPIEYKLKNGNIIEVLTSPKSHGPSRDWLKIVKSNQAKNKINQFFKRADRDQNIIKGKSMIEKEIKRLEYKIPEAVKEDWLEKIVEKNKMPDVEALYNSLGYGSMTLNQVMAKIKDFYEEKYGQKEAEATLLEKLEKGPTKPDERRKNDQGILVRGVDNIKVKFAKCCNPVPGDEIVGYITKGRGVSVHRKDCPNIKHVSEQGRFIEVEWDQVEEISFGAEIQIKALDERGLLYEVTKMISEANLYVSSLNARTNKDKTTFINITIEIKGIDQLNTLMKKIKALKEVIDVYRVIS